MYIRKTTLHTLNIHNFCQSYLKKSWTLFSRITCVITKCICCCYSVTESWPALCDPMDCSIPVSSILQCLPELAQTHVHRISDAIQPSHLLSSPSPPALNLSHHQGLFQCVSSLHQVARGLESFSPSNESVQFSNSVVSDSLRPHRLQDARLPCPSPTPGACSNSCPSSRWCHPAISSSDVPFSSHLQSFQASGSFPINPFFASGGQNVGVSASPSVLPMNIQDWFPLGWTCWISLQSKGLSRVFSNTTDEKHQFFGAQLSLWSNSHIHTWLLEKP